MRHCFLGAKRARHRHERILSASRPLFWVFRSAHMNTLEHTTYYLPLIPSKHRNKETLASRAILGLKTTYQ